MRESLTDNLGGAGANPAFGSALDVEANYIRFTIVEP
jgi:hypothetical protein